MNIEKWKPYFAIVFERPIEDFLDDNRFDREAFITWINQECQAKNIQSNLLSEQIYLLFGHDGLDVIYYLLREDICYDYTHI